MSIQHRPRKGTVSKDIKVDERVIPCWSVRMLGERERVCVCV